MKQTGMFSIWIWTGTLQVMFVAQPVNLLHRAENLMLNWSKNKTQTAIQDGSLKRSEVNSLTQKKNIRRSFLYFYFQTVHLFLCFAQ